MNQEQFNIKLDELSKMLKEIDNEGEKNLNLDIGEIEGDFEKIFDGKITIKYKSNNDKELKYNYPSDSGFDLYSNEEVKIPAFGRALIPTGISVDLPQDYEIQVRSKSGLAINQGLMVLNSPGTVDSGYQGEVKVIIFNTTNEVVKIEKGQKVAQAVFCPVVNGKWVNLTKISEIGKKDRNDNGFGSTGLK